MTESLPITTLGRTGIEVTRLGYGAGHRKPMTEEENQAMVRRVVNSGINFIDTADDYGNSEEMIGLAISDRYDKNTVATKCGSSSSGHNWSRENLLRNVHQSMERLKTERIEIMQLHGATVEDCQLHNVVETLEEMRTKGFVRWIGASADLPDLATFIEWGVFDVFQVEYSALNRHQEHWLTAAAQTGAGIIIRGGVALGEPNVGKGSESQWKDFEIADLDELLPDTETRTTFMLRFTLNHPDIHTNIVGTTNSTHLEQNIEAVKRGPLPADLYEEAKQRLASAGIKPQ